MHELLIGYMGNTALDVNPSFYAACVFMRYYDVKFARKRTCKCDDLIAFEFSYITGFKYEDLDTKSRSLFPGPIHCWKNIREENEQQLGKICPI